MDSRIHKWLLQGLSYNELPYHLKPCFLYLGHFPGGFDIPTKKLIRMWVAEGIVPRTQYREEGEETPEDVAEYYLRELLNRSMVQVRERGSTGRVRSCCLHDSMRNICLLKANEENFLKVVHNQDGNEAIHSSSAGQPFRRIASYLSEETCRKFSWEHGRTPFLRSVLFFSTHAYGTSISQEMKSKFNDFKLLKVLDLENCYIEGKLPRAIRKLMHLRYLSLDCDCVSSIGSLRYLQTLILKTTSRSQDLQAMVSNEIWTMESMRHIYLPKEIKYSIGKLQVGNLGNLQTLQNFDTKIFDVQVLTRMANLKKLGVRFWGNIELLEGILLLPNINRLSSLRIRAVDHLVQDTNLEGLFLSCGGLYKLCLEGEFHKLPDYTQFPPNLIKLTLLGSFLEEDAMETLEKLPNLSVLRLEWRAINGEKIVCASKGFPRLKSLVLKDLPRLKIWHVGKEAMPRLCNLVIQNCRALEMVPEGLMFISTLQELKIFQMPEAFRNRLISGGDDFYKVQHVPSIIFNQNMT